MAGTFLGLVEPLNSYRVHSRSQYAVDHSLNKLPEFRAILPEHFEAISLPEKDSDILCGRKTSRNPEQIMLLSRWDSKI